MEIERKVKYAFRKYLAQKRYIYKYADSKQRQRLSYLYSKGYMKRIDAGDTNHVILIAYRDYRQTRNFLLAHPKEYHKVYQEYYRNKHYIHHPRQKPTLVNILKNQEREIRERMNNAQFSADDAHMARMLGFGEEYKREYERHLWERREVAPVMER